MATLVTLEELRTWTRASIDAPEDVKFAEAVIDAVSLRISEVLGHATWLEDPTDINTRTAHSVALQVARRTFLNPDQEIRTAAIGPISGVSYLEDFAQALTLTEAELERLDSALDASGTDPYGDLGVIRIERADQLTAGSGDIVLNDSDQPASAGILYAHESDAMWFEEQTS